MINISGGILSALIDEANSCSFLTVQQGILFGNRMYKCTEVLSDTAEDKVVDEYLIGENPFLSDSSHRNLYAVVGNA